MLLSGCATDSSHDLKKNESGISHSKVELEQYIPICSDEVTKQLKGNIAAIKNIDNGWIKDWHFDSIILDKDGYIYMKDNENIVKLEGKTSLSDIKYFDAHYYESYVYIVHDGKNVYKMDFNSLTVEEFVLSDNISYVLGMDSNIYTVDKNGTAVTYFSPNEFSEEPEKWQIKESTIVNGIEDAASGLILINDKIYSDVYARGLENLFNEEDYELKDVDTIWGSLAHVFNHAYVQTKNMDLFVYENTELSDTIPVNEKVEGVYALSTFGVDAIVVSESNIYILASELSTENGILKYVYKLETLEAFESIKPYKDNIKGFYYENPTGNLYVLLDNGNLYFVCEI